MVVRDPRKLPEVLSVDEAARLHGAVPGSSRMPRSVSRMVPACSCQIAHLKIYDIGSTPC
jgi:hypothetical protein